MFSVEAHLGEVKNSASHNRYPELNPWYLVTAGVTNDGKVLPGASAALASGSGFDPYLLRNSGQVTSQWAPVSSLVT